MLSTLMLVMVYIIIFIGIAKGVIKLLNIFQDKNNDTFHF